MRKNFKFSNVDIYPMMAKILGKKNMANVAVALLHVPNLHPGGIRRTVIHIKQGVIIIKPVQGLMDGPDKMLHIILFVIHRNDNRQFPLCVHICS